MQIKQEKYYSTKEVAEMIGRSVSTVHAYVQERKLKPVEVRGVVTKGCFFLEKRLNGWLKSCPKRRKA